MEMAQLQERKATLVLTTYTDLASLKPTKQVQRFGPLKAAMTADAVEAFGAQLAPFLNYEEYEVSVTRDLELIV